MSKEKLSDLISLLLNEAAEFIYRWFAWLMVVFVSSAQRALFEYLQKNGLVSVRRLVALMILGVCSGMSAIFIVSMTDYPVAGEAIFVIVYTLLCLRVIDWLLKIETRSLLSLFSDYFWVLVEAIKKKKDG